MHSIYNQEHSNQAYLSLEIKRINNCINSLIACAPLTIHVYQNKVISLIHPVYQKEIDKMISIRDAHLQASLLTPKS